VLESRVKKLFSQGRSAWGASVPDASDLLAKLTVNAGPDFLWIDLEHRPYDIDSVKWIPLICRMKGCVPMVRVAGLDAQLIKKALDNGASAIMVPQVNNAAEARQAVRFAKYPPQGERGCSPLWTYYLDVPYSDYLPAANAETCIVVQVETVEGMANVEAIAAVDGIDVVFAGPLDLSAAMGHIGETQHPDVQKFIAELPPRVVSQGKTAGITCLGFEAAERHYRQGYRFIAMGSLISHGMTGLAAEIEKLRAMEASAKS
jgi:4-hydroxy-2-oxoheptanedioate aldolase